MDEKIQAIRKTFVGELKKAQTSSDVEALKMTYLGRKGPVQELMKALKELLPEQRPQFGKLINDLKEELASRCEGALSDLINKEEGEQLQREKIDVTLPGRRRFLGRKHLLTAVMDEVIEILEGMGFSVQYGPDIDTDYYNFEALNFPKNHPARDMQDTFYIDDTTLLRTHTSNIQARVMEAQKPPIRIIAPGKVYRNEEINARSHVFFHQVEAFYVDEKVRFADLISTLEEFLQKLFKGNVQSRYRPSYFPFVEPGMEVDVLCLVCEGKGCPLCKYTGWLEIAGAGMIHPEVLKNGGIDPEQYTGYAWGLGVERLANLKHGVKDIRYYTINDIRFLQQFPTI